MDVIQLLNHLTSKLTLVMLEERQPTTREQHELFQINLNVWAMKDRMKKKKKTL